MAKDTLDDIAESFTGLNLAFETFKEKSDLRLLEIEKKGSSDVLLDEQLTAINATMDLHQKQLDDYQAAQQRQQFVAHEGKATSLEELDAKAFLWAENAAQDRNDRGPVNFGHEEAKLYKRTFNRFMRKGDTMFSAEEHKALSVGSNPDGGFFVDPDTSGRLVAKVFETSPMRQYASVQVVGTDSLEGMHDNEEANVGWVAETAARPETATPKVEKYAIPLHELYAMPTATQRMLDDANFDVEGWLLGKVTDKFSRVENTSFVSGDGIGKPRGFTTYPNYTSPGVFQLNAIEQFNTGVNGAFAAVPDGGDALLKALYALKMPYRNNASWFLNRATTGKLRQLKDTDGAYIWAPGIAVGQPAAILGYPMATFDDLPDLATGSLSIAVGDMRAAYQIVDRQGVRVLRDPFTSKPYIKYYTTKRVGGAVLNFEAIKLLKFAA
jgi:HK97 family phage major capsid protein